MQKEYIVLSQEGFLANTNSQDKKNLFWSIDVN